MTPDEYIIRYKALMKDREEALKHAFESHIQWIEAVYTGTGTYKRIHGQFSEKIRALDDEYARNAVYPSLKK